MASHHLPLQPTPFVGRANELAEIRALLSDPACRLLTLVGPGGIGKTRLALQAAVEEQGRFEDGTYFVALQPVSAVDFLVSALTDALQPKFYGAESPRTQLLHYLHPREPLLILDNFEHLLDGANLLAAILDAAPRVKFLVTSRETLNLREEWVRVVPTMQFPGDEPDANLADYDATRLFIERARQARGDFRAHRERQHIFRICRLVDGLPLAIELAAARIRTLSCAQIASEIQQSLDVLATSLRNVPERHRNMYVVFEPCWNRLTQAERQIFMGLSVFRGGFEREAAQQIAGASAAMLATLVDKSLLRLSPSGRYEMHELVRQFAEARLAETPDQWEQVKDHHAAYFAAFLHQREPDLNGAGQLRALADIRPELDNIRIMWRRAVAQEQWDTVAQSLDPLAVVLQNRSAWYEAAETMALAANRLQDTRSILLGRLLLWQGNFTISVDPRTIESGLQLLRRGMQILRDFGLVHAHPVSWQKLATWAENSEEITPLIVTTLEEFRGRGDQWSMAHLLVSLGIAFGRQRDFQQAETCARASLTLFREIGNPWGITTALHGLIRSMLAQRKYADAQLYTEELIRLSEAIDDRAGVEWGLLYLGRASYERGDYLTARAQFEQSLAHFQTFGLGEARLHLPYLGMTACRLGNYDQARQHLSDALRLAVTEDSGQQSVLLPETLVFCAELLAYTGQPHRAVEVLTAALPALFPDQWEYTEAEALIRQLSPGLSLDEDAVAKAKGEANDLKPLAASLLEVLQDQSQRSVPQNDLAVRRQPWVDPLSERELEVLQLVADGLSNRAIARQLIVTVGTVKKHLNNIFSKLGVGSRTQAVKRARELHLLS